MSSTERPPARALLEAALRRDPEERDAFLDEACGDDRDLRREVAALLRARHATIDHALDGRLVGPYIIRHEIGRGGMGVVYLAEDTRLARRVALKALIAETGREDSRRERLRREARAAAGLSHQGIATVYALEEIGSDLYLACEYVAGRTLRTILQSGKLAIGEVASIASQIARALAVAHASGVVHRDLKPENIIRTASGVVKILDFGIARIEGAPASHLTQPGTIVGTPAYMAPEQAQGGNISFRTDLFSFGVMVYEMASGANPFDAGTISATIGRIIEIDPVPLSEAAGTGSPLLDRIVATCLHKNPERRYQTTHDLVADLETLERQISSPEAPPPGHTVRPAVATRWWEMHQLVVAAVYVVMLYPAWRARSWLPHGWGLAMFFAVLSCAAIATTLRLNLWFTSRVLPERAAFQTTRVVWWLRLCEGGFIAILAATAAVIGSTHPEFATLMVAVSVTLAALSLLIEPATRMAAFRERS